MIFPFHHHARSTSLSCCKCLTTVINVIYYCPRPMICSFTASEALMYTSLISPAPSLLLHKLRFYLRAWSLLCSWLTLCFFGAVRNLNMPVMIAMAGVCASILHTPTHYNWRFVAHVQSAFPTSLCHSMRALMKYIYLINSKQYKERTKNLCTVLLVAVANSSVRYPGR